MKYSKSQSIRDEWQSIGTLTLVLRKNWITSSLSFLSATCMRQRIPIVISPTLFVKPLWKMYLNSTQVIFCLLSWNVVWFTKLSIADFNSWEREGSIYEAACEINENRLWQMLPMVENIVFRTAYLSLYIIDIVQVRTSTTNSYRLVEKNVRIVIVKVVIVRCIETKCE